MKLIVEAMQDTRSLITEGKDGSKKYFLEGTIATAEKRNRNGRFYPKTILFPRFETYVKEYVNESRAFGELGHPNGPTVNPERVSHMFTELQEDGNNIWGRAEVMGSDNPMGKIVKSFIDMGAKLGMSTRGMGSLREDVRGKVVQDDYRLATAGDVVLDPSAHDAFVQGICEGVEWVMENGQWVPEYRDKFIKKLDVTRRDDRDSMIVEAFERYIRKI